MKKLIKLKVFNLLLFLVVLILVTKNGDARKQSCPNMCECHEDIEDGAKKVVCISKNLISAYVEAPVKTEWLDLGSNIIVTLDEQSFRVSHF